MEMEITLPDDVPVMTLPNAVFFPQALMPLHIFEPRYRQMLKDVLATNRLFAIAGVNPAEANDPSAFEPPFRVATVGIVRACQKNGNGTSNLLLQGLCRIRIARILGEEPYRRIQVRVLASKAGGTEEENASLRRELSRLISLKQRLSGSAAAEITAFLKTVGDPEAFVDIAAFSLCEDSRTKQLLLETLDVNRRLKLFSRQLSGEIDRIKLQRRLQGRLPDDRIEGN